MNYTLEAEKQRELTIFYRNILEDVKEYTERTILDFEEQVAKTNFKHIKFIANRFIDILNSKLPAIIKTNYEDWSQGKDSLAAKIRKEDRENDYAYREAVRLQQFTLDQTLLG